MIYNPARILFTLSLLGSTPLLFAEEKLQQVQASSTDTVDFAPGGAIRVDHSYGDLRVEGWGRHEVEITVIKSMPFDYKLKHPDEASRHLDGVHVVAERKSAAELAILTRLPHRGGLFSTALPHETNGGVMIEYDIHVPRESNLVIHHGTGSVLVSDITGNIDATCGRGDIVLMLRDSGAYSIDAQSKLGTVISDFDGTPRVRRYRLGERYSTSNSQSWARMRLRVGVGGITLKAVPPEAYASGGLK
jgi:hypothetical protein